MSKASDDLPEPESPVTTTRRFKGMFRSMFFRLFTRAPLMMICVGASGEEDVCWVSDINVLVL